MPPLPSRLPIRYFFSIEPDSSDIGGADCIHSGSSLQAKELPMRFALIVTALFAAAASAAAGPASGAVKSPKGTISPQFAIAYVIRDSQHPRQNVVEILLTETAVDPAPLRDA